MKFTDKIHTKHNIRVTQLWTTTTTIKKKHEEQTTLTKLNQQITHQNKYY